METRIKFESAFDALQREERNLRRIIKNAMEGPYGNRKGVKQRVAKLQIELNETREILDIVVKMQEP